MNTHSLWEIAILHKMHCVSERKRMAIPTNQDVFQHFFCARIESPVAFFVGLTVMILRM